MTTSEVWMCAELGGTQHTPTPKPSEHATEADAQAEANRIGAHRCVVYPAQVEETEDAEAARAALRGDR